MTDRKVSEHTVWVASYEVSGILAYLNVLPERELLSEASHRESCGRGVVGRVWLYHANPECFVSGGKPVGSGGAHDASTNHQNIVVVTAG